MRQDLEEEVKLEVTADFAMPDPGSLAPPAAARPPRPRLLDATYYDTDDLRLARSGLSVRYRSGDGEGWTVKLPDGDGGPALLRRELRVEGDPEVVPDEVAGLVTGWARSKPLQRIARLRTDRVEVELHDADERTLATVVDDRVAVYRGSKVVRRWRELEVEATPHTPPGFIDRVIVGLRHAGANVAPPIAKVAIALGDAATAAPDVVVPAIGADPSAGDVVRSALAASVQRLIRHDPGVRLGDDAEDVHQARVATRRLRSDLRTFRSLLRGGAGKQLRAELEGLADVLGRLRDADVLLDRLRRDAARLPNRDATAVAALLRKLAAQREQARSDVLGVMSSPGYASLLDDLVSFVAAPPLNHHASKRAAKVMPGLVRPAWHRLQSAVEHLPDDPEAPDLHAIRLLAKRTRYSVEAVAPSVKGGRKWAVALADLQTVLGEHQDASVAEAWLRGNVAGAGEAEALVAGELVSIQREEAASKRVEWRATWRQARKPKLRRWL